MFKAVSGDNIENYAGSEPEFSMEGYFNGPIKAWGIIQDWRGRVISRFDAQMVGSWDGNTGTLTEDFHYYSNETQKRVWTITKTAPNQYIGQAPDIVGKASGRALGGAVRWNYQMNIPVGDKTYLLKFDDWMWQMNDGVLINRSYLKKFGFTVAELTVFMQKQEQ